MMAFDAAPPGKVGEARAINAEQPAPEPAPKPGANVPAQQRMVVHTAALEVVVKDITAASTAVEAAVDTAGGYVAKADLSGAAGGKRSATWTLKIPAAQYRATLAKFGGLGSLVKQTADSQDVTEEFADLSAQVKSLKAEEEVLQRLLKEAVGRLDDIIKVREQIKAVRLSIDRFEGRMQLLGHKVELSTVTLTVREEGVYVPEPVTPPTEAEPFGTTLAGTFEWSVEALTNVGKALLLAAVAAGPWLPFAVLLALAARWAVRRAVRA